MYRASAKLGIVAALATLLALTAILPTGMPARDPETLPGGLELLADAGLPLYGANLVAEIPFDGLARLFAAAEGEDGVVLEIFEGQGNATVEGEQEDGAPYDPGGSLEGHACGQLVEAVEAEAHAGQEDVYTFWPGADAF